MSSLHSMLAALLCLAAVLVACSAVLVFSLGDEQRSGSVAADTPKDEQVVLVQLLHRHGARTPILDDPALAAEICGPAGCGQLTHNGKMMLEALGNFLHDRYGRNVNTGKDGTSYFKSAADGTPPAVTPAAAHLALLADGQYHMRQMETRSTQVERTIQSADAVIRGVVQNADEATYPVVHTVAVAQDTLILTDTALSMVIPFEIKKNACLNNIDTATLTARFGLSPAQLDAVAQELGMAKRLPCASLQERGGSSIYQWMNCTLNLQDAIASFISMYPDMPTRYPKALAAFDALSGHLAMARVCKYATTTPQQGFLSYELVDRERSNMKEFAAMYIDSLKQGGGPIGGSNHTPLVYHYSAHDTTVAPLAVALGHPDLLLPLFGQTIITELVFDKSKKDDADPLRNAFSIRHWYGAPKTVRPPADGSASNATHFQYLFEPLSVVCAAAGASGGVKLDIKNVTDGSCSLTGFSEYVDGVLKPTNPAGAACYLSKDTLGDISCNVAPAPPAKSHCYTYRQSCPRFACPANFAIEPSTLACVPLRLLSTVSTGEAWALSITNGVIGVLLGMALAFIIKVLTLKEAPLGDDLK